MKSLSVALGALLATSSACVAPKFFVDIPANSTPVREARYYRTQDAANLAAGAAVDQLLASTILKGPTDHFGQRQRCDTVCHPVETFRTTRTGMNGPLYRIGTVLVLGGIRRQVDKGYRESGWLFDVEGATLREIGSFFVAAIRGHF